MKVIFLDFDGVLNSKEWRASPSDVNFDPVAVTLLNELVEKSGANIVLSTSWRWSCRLISIVQHLQRAGFKYPERVIGFTSLLDRRQRGDEIRLWLKQVPVDAFVILDDCDDMGNLFSNLVLTNHQKGLQSKDVVKAMEILNGRG